MRVECHLIRTLHDALPICRRVAAVLCMRRIDITFTAGGTESANLAIKGLALAEPRGRHLVTSPIEHEAVLASIEHLRQAHGFDVSFVEVGAEDRKSVV